MTGSEYHIPVLLRESVAGLAIKPGGIYVDLTFGGGGHAAEILRNLNGGKLIAFDRDPAAAGNALEDDRFQLIGHNYRYFSQYLKYLGINGVDGIIADLGVSSKQLDECARGFTFRQEAELDMRMNPNKGQRAVDLVNGWDEKALTQLIRDYGELRSARQIARRIISHRQEQPILTTKELADAVRDLFPGNRENKMLAQLFQAFRIAVNDEISSLQDMLVQTQQALRTGGRLVVITYHSIEDRLVKNWIRAGNFEGTEEKDLYGIGQAPFRMINRQVIVPGEEEIQRNPRARSAKLRIAERTDIAA